MDMEKLIIQVVNNAPEAVLISDYSGVITYWNRGAELMFGYMASEAVGQSLDLIIPVNLRSRHWQGYGRVMESGETKYQTGLLSSPGVRKDGSRISLEFSMVLLKGEAGEITGCGAVMRDVTGKWQIEKELKARLAGCEGKLLP